MTEFIGVTVLVAGGLMRDVRPEIVGLELVERKGKSKTFEKRLFVAMFSCFHKIASDTQTITSPSFMQCQD